MDDILSEEPSDINYLERRRSTLIIGYECLGPCKENILCFDKGYHIAYRGFDLFFTDIGGRYYVHVATESGSAIVEESGVFKKAIYSDWTDLMKVRAERKNKFKKSIHGDIDMLSHILKESYNNEIWDIEGRKCVSCGACNIVCPTCYCFDVADEMCPDMENGTRYRKWDGCQLRGFCKIATGENFRKSAAERVRHRVFKKEVYLKKRFGRSGCVGCGRCIDYCIADISIIDIFNHVIDRAKEHV
jgi:ferredoxin